MGYETGFPYSSTLNTWWRGFLYPGDILRIHTSTFYQLSYLIGKMIGMDGSYVPYQVVYAMLWWARGLLLFLILRRFFPHNALIAYMAGALALVHAADGALGWVGQLNQFGFIFWMLLAFYLLLAAFQAERNVWVVALTLGACFFEQMSLFSYESPLFLLLVFPAALLAVGRRWWKWAFVSAAWYAIPAAYIYLTVKRYLVPGSVTYQQTVMRKGWTVTSLLSDWWFNISASLEFWKWLHPDPPARVLLGVMSAVLVTLGGVAVLVLANGVRKRRPFTENASAWGLLVGAGFMAVVLSFPAYLLLDSARWLWRTQFLSGVGAAVFFTALLGLISYKVRWQTGKAAILLIGGAAIVYCGSLRALQLGAIHRLGWERHRTAILEVLRLAPSVKPNTVVVLSNVPKALDPFGDDMWFDLALRLVYPGIPVVGVYYYTDGTPAPGDALSPAGDRWKWNGAAGYPPVFEETSLANTIVVAFDPSGKGTLESVLPAFLCLKGCDAGSYNPRALITGQIAPSAKRRYRPDAR